MSKAGTVSVPEEPPSANLFLLIIPPSLAGVSPASLLALAAISFNTLLSYSSSSKPTFARPAFPCSAFNIFAPIEPLDVPNILPENFLLVSPCFTVPASPVKTFPNTSGLRLGKSNASCCPDNGLPVIAPVKDSKTEPSIDSIGKVLLLIWS